MNIANADDAITYSYVKKGQLVSQSHSTGDNFDSLNDTAYALALRYNKWSMVNEKIDSGEPGYEMASYICLDKGKGKYYFSVPESNRRGSGKNVSLDEDYTAIGVIHSHGADSGGDYVDNRFSHKDINNFVGKHKYLVIPSGKLLYRESWFTTTATTVDGHVIVGSRTGIYPD